ncbi:MAG: DUF423 domain-containing protein [Thermoanaerobaculia bacterium]
MIRFLICSGALAAAAAVAAGAFGAHGLQERLSPRSLELWETASRYLIYGGLGTVLAGLAALRVQGRAVPWAAAVLLAGAVVFSGTVFALALGGPRWLGAITPLGGTLMILGFLLLAWGALRL